MAKTDTRDPAADEVEEGRLDNGQEEQVAQKVVSDSRARRKRKRGELVDKDAEAGGSAKKDRPTPSRRGSKAAATKSSASRSFVQRIPIVRSIYNYFVAAASEMTKVTWPTREETVRLTRLVIAVTIAFSIGLGIFDLFYGWWFRQALDHDSLFLGIGVIVLLVAGAITYFVFRQEQPTPF